MLFFNYICNVKNVILKFYKNNNEDRKGNNVIKLFEKDATNWLLKNKDYLFMTTSDTSDLSIKNRSYLPNLESLIRFKEIKAVEIYDYLITDETHLRVMIQTIHIDVITYYDNEKKKITERSNKINKILA